MSDYRFMINADGTITRGKLYRLPSDWTSDAWRNYWDGDLMVGFTSDYHYGSRHLIPLHDDEDNRRATVAHSAEQDNLPGSEGALDRVAQRITENPEACFIHVALDRGTDFYALAWNGDPENTWRDEIEAVWNGDIWRVECARWVGWRGEDSDWEPEDEYPEDFYGEDKATAEFERVFPLAEFPAEQLVEVND